MSDARDLEEALKAGRAEEALQLAIQWRTSGSAAADRVVGLIRDGDIGSALSLIDRELRPKWSCLHDCGAAYAQAMKESAECA
ncbi:hypothetical protein [Amorphus sp. MBR-141]